MHLAWVGVSSPVDPRKCSDVVMSTCIAKRPILVGQVILGKAPTSVELLPPCRLKDVELQRAVDHACVRARTTVAAAAPPSPHSLAENAVEGQGKTPSMAVATTQGIVLHTDAEAAGEERARKNGSGGGKAGHAVRLLVSGSQSGMIRCRR